MIYDVSDAIKELNREIDETKNKIVIVKSIDFTKPVTEKQWHTICETPLRSSDLLAPVYFLLLQTVYALGLSIYI